jgi:hypothetical protein
MRITQYRGFSLELYQMLSHICIKVYSFFKVRDSLVLFLIGCSLMLTGLHGVSVSQLTTEGWPLAANPGEGAPASPANPGKGAPGANAQPAQQSAWTGIAQQTVWTGVSQQSPWTGVSETSAFKGTEAPLDWQLAQQPENPGIGEAEQADVPYDDSLIRFSVGNLYKFIEGAFGALIVVGAGFGAIIAAAVGAYKAAMALFVTAVGAFILRAYVSLFFGTNYEDYTVGAVEPN